MFKHDAGQVITILDQTGNVIKEITSECPRRCYHYEYRQVTEHPADPNFIVESCELCCIIRSYNIHNGEGKTICKCKPLTMCVGPDQTLLVLDDKKQLLKLQWNKEKKQLELTTSIQTNVTLSTDYNRMCYVKKQNICVFTLHRPHSVTAVKHTDGSTLWEVSGQINGRMIKPTGVTCDDLGCVYVVDRESGRLLIFDSLEGMFLQEKELIRDIWDVCLARDQLIVLHSKGEEITLFDIN